MGEQYLERDRQQREQTTGERVFGYISLLSNLEGISIRFNWRGSLSPYHLPGFV